MRFWIYLFVITLFACQTESKTAKILSKKVIEKVPPRKHFQIIKEKNYFIIEINTPFVEGDFTERYIAYPKETERPDLDSVTHYIPYPINSLAVTSTTHVGFLSAINGLDFIKASNNIDWVYNPDFHNLVKQGSIISIGNRDLNQEELVNSEVDVVLSYAIDASNYQQIRRWRELGQKVVLISEFMEQDPLNKAAWLEVIGLLIGKQKESIDYLTRLNHDYDSLKMNAMYSSQASSLFMGFPWKGTWYMSGGKSFQAKLFKDAQGYYLWADSPKESGMPLNVETVIEKAINADVWLNTNSINSLEEIKESDERFTAFKAFKSGRVYNFNKRVNKSGGNDYWESGVVHPDWILRDLVKIFHPIFAKDYEFIYYQQLK